MSDVDLAVAGNADDSEPCTFMTFDIGNLEDPMVLDLSISTAPVMTINLCTRLRADYVTHNGQVVTHEGEPVYVVLED